MKLFKKSNIYKALKISNDLNALKKGKILKRIGRRVGGKASGGFMSKLFKNK